MPDFPRWKHPLEDISKFIGIYTHEHLWKPANRWEVSVTGSGSVSWTTNFVGLSTGTTSTSVVHIYRYFSTYKTADKRATWDSPRIYSVMLYFSAVSYQVAHILTGGIADPASSVNASRHIGFKIVNDVLYGSVGDGSYETEVALETLTTAGLRRLIAILTPATRCRFYIDGVLKGEATTNLPTGSVDHFMLRFSIYNTEAVDKRLYVYDLKYLEME